jgi:hypothetical protein
MKTLPLEDRGQDDLDYCRQSEIINGNSAHLHASLTLTRYSTFYICHINDVVPVDAGSAHLCCKYSGNSICGVTGLVGGRESWSSFCASSSPSFADPEGDRCPWLIM